MSLQSKSLPESLILPTEGDRKRIFLAGKGGVGKTTMACATALYTADCGYKTLLVTTDPAAHLADVLGQEVSASPKQILNSKLWAVRIDPKVAFERYKERILLGVKERFGSEESIAVVQEELDSPCTEEIAVFQEFLDDLLSDDYEVLVFDTAPTGHTLRLLQLAWDYETELSHKSSFTAETSALDNAELSRMREAIRVLQSKRETTMAFVTLAESTPIAEMDRAIEDLERADIETQAIIVNQMLPEEASGSRLFGPRRERQQAYLVELERRHGKRFVTECELSDDDVLGDDALRQIAAKIFVNHTVQGV
ncbi:ArsA family ATPase [Alicyclobacillus mengziensis]|uniref:ArsA family ATPase n=1 Tax=Alicyclobacillus mengziensis TaxID=2931921 RepID=A0A9X7Z8Z7_9BACL|nr:ArsA family ATPase [Alicyclobacillus mengziensis]QSO48811.1 ArsA family ATPase [Alicyclobacillus mengziensis]